MRIATREWFIATDGGAVDRLLVARGEDCILDFVGGGEVFGLEETGAGGDEGSRGGVVEVGAVGCKEGGEEVAEVGILWCCCCSC